MFYAIKINSLNVGYGSHFYAEEPPELPSGESACTEEQAKNPEMWQLDPNTNTIIAIPPTLVQQASALIAAGLTITSTSTPEINGTYTVASGVSFGREDIGTETQFISTFGEFTNGTTELEWPLIDGKTFVKFPDTTDFMNFAKAAAQFYAACKAVMAVGTGTLPSDSVVIP